MSKLASRSLLRNRFWLLLAVSLHLDGGAPALADCDWRNVTLTGTAGTGSRLRIFLNSPGDVYIDDPTLVAGTIPEAGPNLLRNGDFESEFPGTNYIVSANYSNSATSTAIKRSGNASLHLVGLAAGTSDGNIIYQDITPAISM